MPSTKAQPPLKEWPAIALVVEASHPVAQEWRTYHSMLVIIVRRLLHATGTGPLDEGTVALVAYGSPSTFPSPIICKRYFDVAHTVFLQLQVGREVFGKRGCGLSAAGDVGMASLDALVAAIELFDHLASITEAQPRPRSFVKHLIHITSAGPDASLHPTWNDRSARDNLTWGTLPAAFKESKIQYTVFSTQALAPQYQALYEALNEEKSVSQWLTVKPPGSVLSAKLPEEEPPKRLPETEKSQPQPPPTSTGPARPTATALPPQVPPKALTSIPGGVRLTQARETARTSPAQTLPPSTLNTPIINRSRTPAQVVQSQPQSVEEDIRIVTPQANTPGPVEVSNVAEPDRPRAAYGKQRAISQKGKRGNGQPGRSVPPRAGLPVEPPKQTSTGHHPPAPVPQPPHHTPSTSVLMQNTQPMHPDLSPSARAIIEQHGHQQPQAQAQLPPSNINPVAAAQWAQYLKMVTERSGRGWPTVPGPSMPIQNPHMQGGMGIQMQPGQSGMPHRHTQRSFPAQTQVQQQPQEEGTEDRTWEGPLCFEGSENGQIRKLQVRAVASTSIKSLARFGTWPDRMILLPTRPTNITLEDIREWFFATCATWIYFKPSHYKSDTDTPLEALVQLLHTSKMCATAAWRTPTGSQTSNMFLFPQNGTDLIGACFPMCGIPTLPGKILIPFPPDDIPKALMIQQFNHTAANLTLEQRQALEATPVAQRTASLMGLAKTTIETRLNNYRQEREAKRQLAQLASSSAAAFGVQGNNVLGANPSTGMGGMLAPMGMPHSGIMNTGGMNMGGGVGGPMMDPSVGQTGGIPANISKEMYLAYLARSQNGSRSGGA